MRMSSQKIPPSFVIVKLAHKTDLVKFPPFCLDCPLAHLPTTHWGRNPNFKATSSEAAREILQTLVQSSRRSQPTYGVPRVSFHSFTSAQGGQFHLPFWGKVQISQYTSFGVKGAIRFQYPTLLVDTTTECVTESDKHNLVRLEPIFYTDRDASQNDAHFRSGQKWLKNNHISTLV